MSHSWIPSTLGHGDTMCEHCCMTSAEANALGRLDDCAYAPVDVEGNKPIFVAYSNNATVENLHYMVENWEKAARVQGATWFRMTTCGYPRSTGPQFVCLEGWVEPQAATKLGGVNTDMACNGGE